MANQTVIFSSKNGDVALPITQSAIDGVNVSPSNVNFILPTRAVQLTEVSTDTGLPMLSVTASGSLPGISRVAGTSIALNGVTTSGAQTVTTKMLWELAMPMTYVNGNTILINVNCVVPTATNVTAATTTMTLSAYSVTALGAEVALTVTPSVQLIPLTTAGTLSYVVSGANSTNSLMAGQKFEIELTMAVTTVGGGASFGQVNSVTYAA